MANWFALFGLEGDELAAVVTTLVVMMIPIVAILTRHQQKMAQIIHGDRSKTESLPESSNIQSELAELKSLVKSQALAIENLAAGQRQLQASLAEQNSEVNARLNS